jgi:PAS domain S-box-containing protein
VPLSETARLAALRAFEVLDTPAEPAFDRLTALAADLFDTPMALVSLIDEHRQWFKSRLGIEACSTPREEAFCDHTLHLPRGQVLVVEDAARHPIFQAYPAVTGEMGVRFYAGAVLTTADGAAIGALCVLDTKPRPRPSDRQLAQLVALGDLVIEALEARQRNRQAEREAALLHLAGQMSGVGAWRYQCATGRVSWSDAVYAIHGVTRQTFDPNLDSAIGFYHPDDRAIVTNSLEHAAATGEGFEFQARLIDENMCERTVISRATCEQDDTGKVVSILGVFQDVTEHTNLLKDARRGEARFRLLADNMADVVTRIRLDGRSGYISPAITDLLGYRPSEMIGRTAQSFVHPEDRGLILDVYAAMAEGAAHSKIEHRAVRKDGGVIWVETHFKLLRDADGRPSEMIAVIRDVSARKAMEAELLAARAEAEAAAAAKAEFLANMSHEIRTPLTSVIGFSGLLAALPDLPPSAQDHVRRIQNGGRALLATVNDILDFSKLEAGQVEIRPEPCDVAAVAREALELFEATAQAKGLSLSLTGATPPAVWLDPGRLRQILLNLVGNGVKFTDAGGVTVQMVWSSDRMRIEVADTGVGIAPASQVLLFRKFSQVDGSSTRRHGGTGLGLAICRALAEAMGGEVGVDSAVGQGSTFWIDLPAPLAQADQVAQTGTPLEAEGQADLTGVRVLIADDNLSNLKLAKALLEALGAQCHLVSEGREAVTVASESLFDLILMDLRMPGLDGVEAARAIRQGGGPNDSVPILAFTAQRPGDLDPVFAGTVDKPIQPDALQAAIMHALEGPAALENHHAA